LNLKAYQNKRQFKKTPEPKGKSPKASKSKTLEFVVQKHAATRLHYDFRIEIGGVYKSWAVPKGFTLNPSEQRLAIAVEDHPLEYGKFEGVIPKGHYGAGTVMIWDKGTYLERFSKDKKESEAKLIEGLKKGHITLLLSGQKLRGEFALVRLKDKKSPNMWLLIKKRDQYASYLPLSDDALSVISNKEMADIRVDSIKQGKLWIPRKGPQKAVKDIVPVKAALPRTIIPMRAVQSTEPMSQVKFAKNDWMIEPADMGQRVVVTLQKGQVLFYSVRGMTLSNKAFEPIKVAVKKLGQSVVLDGEIVEGAAGMRFIVTDLLYVNGKDYHQTALIERKKALKKLKLKAPLEIVEGVLDVDKIKTEAKAIVFKFKHSDYQPGISRDWVKFKVEQKQSESRPRFTNTEKIYWPELKLTKGDMLEYYDSMSEWILPYLQDRPLSLNRHPDGIDGESFYQKDLTGHVPKWVSRKRIYSESSRKSIDYAMCQNKDSLLYFANLGCIEMNPWLAREDKLEYPDWCVIDLDPAGHKFDVVIQVAQDVHRVLKKYNIHSHVKTSGGEGMHIFIKLDRSVDFDLSRQLATFICGQVQEKLPKITTLERNPQKRGGRIYLDCLQNRRGQTLAAPYCLRPTKEATVSMPLEWSEVKRGLKPTDFTMFNAKKRLQKKGDIWQTLLDEEGLSKDRLSFVNV
jgi:bifunctional non-homologous end joining protein LigD